MWNEDPLVGWGDVDVLRIKGGEGVKKKERYLLSSEILSEDSSVGGSSKEIMSCCDLRRGLATYN